MGAFFDNIVRTFFYAPSVMSNYNMNSHRKSQDPVCNNEGNILLKICKSNNLFILNGRCGKDKEAGSFTLKKI